MFAPLRWLRSAPAVLLWAGVVGLMGALATVVFREAIFGVEWLLSGRTGGVVEVAFSLTWWHRMLLPALGGLLAGLVLQAAERLPRERSPADYMTAIAAGHGLIAPRTTVLRSISSLLSIGSGGSIGREGAMVHLAAWIGSLCGHMLKAPRARVRLLVACGAAAGVAAAYNAPIAGALFVAEVVLGSMAIGDLAPLVFASVVATATVHHFYGYAPLYTIPPLPYAGDWELPFFFTLGALLGIAAVAFLRLVERARTGFRRITAPLYVKLAMGGAVVGAISAIEPRVWGNGYSVVSELLSSGGLWQGLAVLLALKMLATAATVGSGAVGGIFTPGLFVGAVLGHLYGQATGLVAPVSHPAIYAIVGMGAFLAGTTHAPLMSILMMFEMTLDYALVLPLMLACVTAHYVATAVHGESMYAQALRRMRQDAGTTGRKDRAVDST